MANKENIFFQTRDVINHCLKYVSGDVGDIGAEAIKYKPIIMTRASSYLSFSGVAGKNIDSVGDFLKLPFPENNFDTVISAEALEHTKSPKTVIAEMERVLRPGGFCIITVPFLLSYHGAPNDYFRFTQEGVISLFEDTDLEIVETGSYGKLFSVIFQIIQCGYFRRKKFKGQEVVLKFFKKMSNWLDKFVKNENIYGNIYVVAKNNKQQKSL